MTKLETSKIQFLDCLISLILALSGSFIIATIVV